MAQETVRERAGQAPATSTSTSTSTNGAGGTGKEAAPPAGHRFIFGAAVPLLILLSAAAIFESVTHSWNGWTGAQAVQRTNDASVRADVTPLSTRVSGTVVKMAVEDYQRVKAGELLVRIKSDDYR